MEYSDTLQEEQRNIFLKFTERCVFDGWNNKTFESVSLELYESPHQAYLFFPKGFSEIFDFLSLYIDSLMLDEINSHALQETKTHKKILELIALRIKLYTPFKKAITAYIATIYQPSSLSLASQNLWKTSDNFWHLAGDKSLDFNYYSKRIILCCVYSKTLLYWLNDNSQDSSDTFAFAAKEIEQVLTIGKIKKKITENASKIMDLPFIRLIKHL
jgi:ubiquinone biosynthesis protein COQ9